MIVEQRGCVAVPNASDPGRARFITSSLDARFVPGFDPRLDIDVSDFSVLDRRAVWLGLGLVALSLGLASTPQLAAPIHEQLLAWIPAIDLDGYRERLDVGLLLALTPVVGLGVGLVNRRTLGVSLTLALCLALALGTGAWTIDNLVLEAQVVTNPLSYVLGPVLTLVAAAVWALVLGPLCMVGALLGAGLRQVGLTLFDS